MIKDIIETKINHILDKSSTLRLKIENSTEKTAHNLEKLLSLMVEQTKHYYRLLDERKTTRILAMTVTLDKKIDELTSSLDGVNIIESDFINDRINYLKDARATNEFILESLNRDIILGKSKLWQHGQLNF